MERISGSGHALWGYAKLICNTETDSAEFQPMRSSELHLNVAGPVMSTHGMSVAIDPVASDFPNGLFVMDISLTHPFPGKTNLSGFDVKGILITPGTFVTGSLTLAGPDETELKNRDGLTRWWNPTEFTGGGLLGYTPGSPGCKDSSLLTATVNPYKVFADSLGPTSPLSDLTFPLLDDPTGRAVFSAGTTNTRRYEIQFPVSGGPVIIFNYAIDASWAKPDPSPPVEVPDDFPMNANQPEAFRTQIVFPNNTLTYLEGGGVAGELRVSALVSDWQGIAAGDIHDEVFSVTAFAPTLLSEAVTLDLVAESFDHAEYQADLTPYLLALNSADPHLLLVMVRAQDAGDYTQGGTTVGPVSPVSAFQTAWVEIESVTCEADGNEDFAQAQAIDLDGSAFGTLCNPGGSLTDARDFYTFEVPPTTKASGGIEIQSLQEPTSITLYDGSFTELATEWVQDGSAKILSPSELATGTYYVKVLTENEQEMVYYDLINKYTLDPCYGSIAFSWEAKVDVPDLNNVYSGRRAVVTDLDEVWVAYTEGSYGAKTVLCRHSSDGGITFDPPVQVNLLEIACERLSPSIARDKDGNLYCGWIDYGPGMPSPFVGRSADGGANWFPEVNIYDFELNPIHPDNIAKGILLGSDDSGRLHALWMDDRDGSEDHLYYSYSDTQGAVWHPASQVDQSTSSLQTGEREYDLDVAPDGKVVCVWTDRRHLVDPPLSGLDIYCDHRDSVTSFGVDAMVNSAALDIEQTNPGVSITDDGIIHVVWVDRRNDGAYGGSNPPNTWELYYARSEDGGSTFISEQEISAPPGYSGSSGMDPRVETSPWGDVYVQYLYATENLLLSKSCNGGDIWESPVTIYPDSPDTYIMGSTSLDLASDGRLYSVHGDTRIEPGPDYTHWNLYLAVSE